MFLDANDELKEIDPDVRCLPEILGVRLLVAYSDLGIIHYNLACYECQLGHLELAKGHLKRTFEIEKSFRAEALDDPVLKPLWDSLTRCVQ